MLAGLTIPPTGAQSRPIMLVTKSLLFTAEGSGGQPILRALDKHTGEKVWEMTLPGAVGSVPMTYAIGNRQFIAVRVAGRASDLPATLVAIALPRAPGGRHGGAPFNQRLDPIGGRAQTAWSIGQLSGATASCPIEPPLEITALKWDHARMGSSSTFGPASISAGTASRRTHSAGRSNSAPQ